MTPDALREAPPRTAPRIAVLGPVVATTSDGRSVEPAGATARALLAALALAAPAARGVDALADDVWGDDLPQNPRGALQTLVSRIRSAAGADLVRSDPSGYALGVPADAVDLGRARRLRDAAETLAADDPARLALADEALALWRGEAGADLADAPVAEAIADAATALRAELEALRARSLVAVGRAADASAALAALAASRPYDEALHVELMTALAAAGRVPDALAVFAALRSRLRDDLGVTVGPAASALNARLLRGEDASGPPRIRVGLRAAPNELIGRETDLARVADLLARSRAVTILGAGGLGKTRLAQAAAAASAAPSVVVVALAGVRSDGDVPLAIASTLGISEATPGGRLADPRARLDLRARVVALLSDRATLLVLDNCEQVIDAVAAWAADMLEAVPTLRILTTSRTPLAIAAETVYPLPSLTSGDGDEPGSAVRLFRERARAVRPGATLPSEVVARLCERLDGLPLAIELAAARVRTMTVEHIEARLEDRFGLLTSGDRAAPARHRTLEAVIEWSWDLLDVDAQTALATLSVLPGGFTASTAAGVLAGGRADDLLDRLVAQSLLVVIDDPQSHDLRFRMLETVREFALARLVVAGGEDAAWDGVLAWARAFALSHGPGLFGAVPTAPASFREVRAEHDNLLAALRRAVAQRRRDDVVLVFAVLGASWVMRGAFTELAAVVPVVRDGIAGVGVDDLDADVPVDALALVLTLCTILSLFLDEDPAAIRTLARIRIVRRRAVDRMSPSWRALTAVLEAVARPERMPRVVAELCASDDPAMALVGEFLVSQLTENDGDAAAATRAARRAWELAQQLDEQWLAAMAAMSMAQLACEAGRPAESLAWLDRARDGYELFGVEEGMRQQEWVRGSDLLGIGRFDEAHALFEELLHGAEGTQDGIEPAAMAALGLAELDRARGDRIAALVGYERTVATFRTRDQRLSPWYPMAISCLVSAAALDGTLPPADVARWARRLRGRLIAQRRLMPRFIDKPVLGTVLVGWAAWALSVPGLCERGVEALALAEALGARQDWPTLRPETHRAHAVGLAGAEVVEAARAAASALSSEERVDRMVALLRETRP